MQVGLPLSRMGLECRRDKRWGTMGVGTVVHEGGSDGARWPPLSAAQSGGSVTLRRDPAFRGRALLAASRVVRSGGSACGGAAAARLALSAPCDHTAAAEALHVWVGQAGLVGLIALLAAKVGSEEAGGKRW